MTLGGPRLRSDDPSRLAQGHRTSEESSDEMTDPSYGARIGRRLREVRRQQRLSLRDVEEASHGRLKASAVGSYERGTRALDVTRLRELAEFYRIPVWVLIPSDAGRPRTAPGASFTLDVERLSDADDLGELEPVRRLVELFQSRRGDVDASVLTVRRADAQRLAAVLGLTCQELLERLAEKGLTATRIP